MGALLNSFAVAVVAASMAQKPSEHARAHTAEYPTKAEFLYKFGSFVEWPASALPVDAAPLSVCVVGRDPFGRSLDRLAHGQKIGAHPVVVRRIATVSPASGCHIAYLGGSSEQTVADAEGKLSSAPVLTVTDGDREVRGIIHMLVRNNRVQFEIDQKAAERAGVAISSKLLNLAVLVRK